MTVCTCTWALILFTGLVALDSSSATPNSVRNSSAKADSLFDNFWRWKISQYPEWATFVGLHDNNTQLNNQSETALLSRFQKCEQFLSRANEVEPSLTNEVDILNMKILRYELNMYLDFFDLKGYYLPVTYGSGPQSELKRLFKRMPLNTYDDYNVMIKRLENVPAKIDGAIDLMRAGVENNMTNHAISMKNLNESIGEYIVDDPTESPFYELFNATFPASLTSTQIEDIQTRAQTVIQTVVVPAFQNLLDYVQNEYVTREDIAVSSIQRGIEFYNSLIWFRTGTNLTAQQIHDIGHREVTRIEGEMLKIIKEIGKEELTTQEFSDLIRDDPNNYFNNSEEMVAAYEDIVYNRINPRLSRIFKTIPQTEVTVKADPTPKRSGAFYVRGGQDSSKKGTFYVYSHYPESQPKYRMMSLALHEANPGHHFHAYFAIESRDFSTFRKRYGGGLSNAYPSRFPSYTFMAEGWSLYAEGLGFDMDLYNDPLERFGHYNEEMYRAVRLVVDTGIHALGWTKDQAVEFMFNHTAFTKISVENQIDRYITTPGQALAYKIGQLKIRSWRADAEAKLGADFDLKEFHDVILRSFGPLDIVEEEVNKWIEGKLTKQTPPNLNNTSISLSEI